jgi:aryl-alcohol dehydrogenase-like predicted oxidoreductase
MLMRQIEDEILPFCEEKNVGVIPYSTMQNGLLELVETLREIGDGHGRSPAEVAVAWVLRHPAVTAAIVGARSADQVDGFVGAMDFRLSDDEIAKIGAELPESISLI